MPSPILRHFKYEHLRPDLQEVSKPICELARQMDATLPDGAEKSAGLRKLLEAKDCLVRAHLEGAEPKVLPRVLTLEDAASYLELAVAEEERLYRQVAAANPSIGPRGPRGSRLNQTLGEYLSELKSVEAAIFQHRADLAHLSRTPDDEARLQSEDIYASVKRMGLGVSQ